jgi:hypothetical protein
MRLLDFPRPRSCELAEARVLAEHAADQQRVIEEHGQRPTLHHEPVELVRFLGESTRMGLITDVANDLERSGRDVSVRWIRDDVTHLIIGAAICEVAP